jgi:hypothetical protein
MSSRKLPRKSFTKPKRHADGVNHAQLKQARDQLQLLIEDQHRVLKPLPSSFAFDMDVGLKSKIRMVDYLWGCDYNHSIGAMLADNPELASMLQSCVHNTYLPEDEELFMFKQCLKLENVVAVLYRCQNQKMMPLFIVLRALFCHAKGLHREIWFQEAALRLLPSFKWTNDLVTVAIPRNPGPPFPIASFISAAVLDNFTVQVSYKSLHDLDHVGYRLDMTNWGSVSVPAAAQTTGVNIPRMILSE